ncbi:MAG: serine/threonine-protein kinase [Thiogranum sp.]
MSSSSWKSYRLAVAMAAAAALLTSFSSDAQRLEALLLDWGSYLIPEAEQTHSVAVVAIDAATLDEYGSWPLPRDQLAQAVKRLKRFNPKALGFMLPLTAAETATAVGTIRQELDSLDTSLRKKAKIWLRQLDTDARLARALKPTKNVVLVVPYRAAKVQTGIPRELQRYTIGTEQEAMPWYRTTLQRLRSAPPPDILELSAPLPLFLDTVSGVGASAFDNDERAVRGTVLLVEADGQYLPGFELSLLAAAQGFRTRDLIIDAERGILTRNNKRLGTADLNYYPRPATAPPVHSLNEVMASDSLAGSLRNKIVLLGLTATGVVPELTGPAGRSYSPVTWSAQVLDSMLNGRAFTVPNWFYALQRALLVLFAMYLMLMPATWHGVRGLVVSGLLATILLNTGLVSLLVQGLWLPVVGPALFLTGAQLLLSLSWCIHNRLITAQQRAIEARVALGTNLQSQGHLDLALDQLTQCLPAPAAFEPLYELAREYERHRQASKAQTIYAQLQESARGFRDSTLRLNQLADLSDRFPNAGTTPTSKTLVLDAPVMELPVLGRYRLERELGRGAMGTVYLATDPTIGREVAVKTLPLLQEYEGREQQAAAERFFKEAEAVGRLAHPHIVTIYDAGQEHDLAYIAMDYVPGESLDTWTGGSGLLPVWEVLEIAAQIADALSYAHGRHVVHRDIKPGNIIYNRDSGVAKITDFGIARILDASQTRTGTVLGSPSYMSPEQVAGKKTDGRSDLFSLGTTLYQLLSGSLPFNGDSVAALMYQIANQKTPAMRKSRRGLPVCVSRLVMKALQKDPAKRFASGEVMAVAIRKCRAQFRGGRRKTA